MIIISYQILSEHVARFSRWKSYKAYAILNGLEIVFWAAVIFLVLQANIKSCAGVSCTLRWIAVAVSAVITYDLSTLPFLTLTQVSIPCLFNAVQSSSRGAKLFFLPCTKPDTANKEAKMLTQIPLPQNRRCIHVHHLIYRLPGSSHSEEVPWKPKNHGQQRRRGCPVHEPAICPAQLRL